MTAASWIIGITAYVLGIVPASSFLEGSIHKGDRLLSLVMVALWPLVSLGILILVLRAVADLAAKAIAQTWDKCAELWSGIDRR